MKNYVETRKKHADLQQDGTRLGNIMIYVVLAIVSFICIYPLYYVLVLSLSSPQAVLTNSVYWLPDGIYLDSYKVIFKDTAMWRAYAYTLFYVAATTVFMLCTCVMVAYPLTCPKLIGRKWLTMFLLIPMYFSGGLIPTFLLMSKLNLYNNVWAIIVPGCFSIWYIILTRTYFASISESMREAARSNCLNDLMQGLFNEEKISARLLKNNIPYENNQYFCVNIISYDELYLSEDNEHDFNLFLAIKSCLLSQQIEFDLFEKHDNQIAVIFRLDEEKSDEIFDVINTKIKVYVKSNYNIEIKAYCGPILRGLLGISKSYQNAKRLLQEDKLKRNVGIERAYSLTKIPYYYPTDWEFQLINQLKIGQEKTAIAIINELEKENLELSLPQDMMIKVTILVFETIIRIMKEMNMDIQEAMAIFDSSVIASNAANQWNCLRKIAALVCSRQTIAENKSSLGKQLFDYVLENYSDCELSLKSLSDRFSLSVSAISKTFKGSAGINFLDYLTRLRMEKAKELLKDTDISVSDISLKVGYDNMISFKRAFLRYTGIKPTEYRNLK